MGKHGQSTKGAGPEKGRMTAAAAARIQSAGDRAPACRTAQTGFGPRAQSAAARNAPTNPAGKTSSADRR